MRSFIIQLINAYSLSFTQNLNRIKNLYSNFKEKAKKGW